eukprot:COSAG02_NODE_1926_length_10341_cov_25.525776_9_plen_108_part_00
MEGIPALPVAVWFLGGVLVGEDDVLWTWLGWEGRDVEGRRWWWGQGKVGGELITCFFWESLVTWRFLLGLLVSRLVSLGLRPRGSSGCGALVPGICFKEEMCSRADV